MTTEHTPTPWVANRGKLLRVRSSIAPYSTVAGIHKVGLFGARAGNAEGQAEANAAFIVRACNLHGDMVAALEALAPNIPAMGGTRDLQKQVVALLKLARAPL